MKVHPGRRALAGMTVALVVGFGVVAGVASPAEANAKYLVCTGTVHTTLSPGLLITPQDISTQNNYLYNPCVSSDPTLNYGTLHDPIAGRFSCVDPWVTYERSKTIMWDNGETSTFYFHTTFSTIAGQGHATHTGVVTAGKFAGATAIETFTAPHIDLLECLMPPGIESRESVVTLEVVAL